MSPISLKGNSYKYFTCDAVGPVPSFLLTAQRGFKWAASTRPGPNDVRHVVWYFSFLLCFIVTYLNVDSNKYITAPTIARATTSPGSSGVGFFILPCSHPARASQRQHQRVVMTRGW